MGQQLHRNTPDIRLRVSHDALLTHWERAKTQIKDDKALLEVRRRVETDMRLWEQSGRLTELLLPAGLKLIEAKNLLTAWGQELEGEIQSYIEASLNAEQERQRKERETLEELEHNLGLVFLERSNKAVERKDYGVAQVYALHALAKLKPDVKNWQLISKTSPIFVNYIPLAFHSTNLTAHFAQISKTVHSPDGQILVTVSNSDKTTCWWCLKSGKLLGTLRDHTGCIAFSHDGRILASESSDQTIRLLEITSGKELQILSGHKRYLTKIAFSRDENYLIGDGGIRWEIKSGQYLQEAKNCIDHYAVFWDDANTSSSFWLREYEKELDAITIENQNINEHPHLANNELFRRQQGHCGIVNSLSFSPNGRMLASGADDAIIFLCDLANGTHSQVLTGHTQPIRCLAFMSNSKVLASGSDDRTVRIWDINTTNSQEPKVLEHTSAVTSIAFNHDGTMIVTGCADGTVRIWSTTSDAKLGAHYGPVKSIAFSKDGNVVVSGSDDFMIRLWNLAEFFDTNGEKVTPYVPKILDWHTSSVQCLAFDRFNTLISGSDDATIGWRSLPEINCADTVEADVDEADVDEVDVDEVGVDEVGVDEADVDEADVDEVDTNKTRINEIYINAEMMVFAIAKLHGSPIRSFTFSSSDETLVSASIDGVVSLWGCDFQERGFCEYLHVLESYQDTATSIALSADGRTLAKGFINGSVLLYDLTKGLEKKGNEYVNYSEPPIKPDEDGITIWDGDIMADYHENGALHPNIIVIRPYREKNFLLLRRKLNTKHMETQEATLNKSRWNLIKFNFCQVWWDNFKNGEIPITFTDYYFTCAAISPDGHVIAMGLDNEIYVEYLNDKKKSIVLHGHKRGVVSVAFSPDGKTLASGSEDTTVRLWDAISGKQLMSLVGHTYLVTNLHFSPNGVTVASASGLMFPEIRLWDVTNGKCLWSHEARASADSGKAGNTTSEIVFSPNGHLLATAFRRHTVNVWCVEDGTLLRSLVHETEVFAVAFSEDGNAILTYEEELNDFDKEDDNYYFINVWEIASGRKFQVLTMDVRGDRDIDASFNFSFSPDGSIFALNGCEWTLPYQPRPLAGFQGNINSVAISPDGCILAVGTDDETIRLYDLNGKVLRILKGHTDAVNSVAFSHDGFILVSGSSDGTIRLWNPTNGEEIWKLDQHNAYIKTVLFRKSGYVIESVSSSGNGDVINFWDLTFFVRIYYAYLRGNIANYIPMLERQIGYTLDGLEVRPYVYNKPNLYGNTPLPPKWSKRHPLRWLPKAESGDVKAMLKLGIIYYYSGEHHHSRHWLTQAQAAGNPKAAYYLNLLDNPLPSNISPS